MEAWNMEEINDLRQRTAEFTPQFEEKFHDIIIDLGACIRDMTADEVGEMIKAVALILAMKRQKLKCEAEASAAATWC